jgi:MFS family permease
VWFLVTARLLATMGNHLTQVHIVAFFITAGYSPLLAASALGAVGLVGMVGRPLSGTLSDLLGREVIYTVGSGMQISGIVAILTLGDGQRLWPIILFVALNGLSDGIGGLVVGAKAADLFPTRAPGFGNGAGADRPRPGDHGGPADEEADGDHVFVSGPVFVILPSAVLLSLWSWVGHGPVHARSAPL